MLDVGVPIGGGSITLGVVFGTFSLLFWYFLYFVYDCLLFFSSSIFCPLFRPTGLGSFFYFKRVLQILLQIITSFVMFITQGYLSLYIL
jgi:hypothetical protein